MVRSNDSRGSFFDGFSGIDQEWIGPLAEDSTLGLGKENGRLG